MCSDYRNFSCCSTNFFYVIEFTFRTAATEELFSTTKQENACGEGYWNKWKFPYHKFLSLRIMQSAFEHLNTTKEGSAYNFRPSSMRNLYKFPLVRCVSVGATGRQQRNGFDYTSIHKTCFYCCEIKSELFSSPWWWLCLKSQDFAIFLAWRRMKIWISRRAVSQTKNFKMEISAPQRNEF